MSQLAVAMGIGIVGAIMGLFLKPKTVALLGAGLFGVCVLGILVGAALGMENFTFLSGVAGMAAPYIAVLLFLGSVVGAWTRRIRQRNDRRRE